MASRPEENNWNRRTQPFPIPPEQLQFGEMFFSEEEIVTTKGSASERFGRFTPSCTSSPCTISRQSMACDRYLVKPRLTSTAIPVANAGSWVIVRILFGNSNIFSAGDGLD